MENSHIQFQITAFVLQNFTINLFEWHLAEGVEPFPNARLPGFDSRAALRFNIN